MPNEKLSVKRFNCFAKCNSYKCMEWSDEQVHFYDSALCEMYMHRMV